MKKVKNSIKSEIPKEIKIVFGKFYIFSIFIFILLLMYPFFIMKYISIYSNVAIVIVLPVWYLLMIIDVVRKREVYRWTLFSGKVKEIEIDNDFDLFFYEENGALLEAYYRQNGGTITTIGKENCGHHPHGLEDCTPIIEFAERYSK